MTHSTQHASKRLLFRPFHVSTFFIAAMYFLPPLWKWTRSPSPLTLKNSHEESISLVTYGKWLLEPPHAFLTDGISGTFQTFYNYLSDFILNILSTLFHLPPMACQVLIYGPLLGVLFFLGNYWALKQLIEERETSPFRAGLIPAAPPEMRFLPLVGALILSLGGDSHLGALLFDPTHQQALSTSLHVPFHTIALGTAQSLGWVLFLPTLVLLYLSEQQRKFEWKSVRISLWAGVLLGLLLQTHTLTFLNVAYAHGFYLVVKGLGTSRCKLVYWFLIVSLYVIFLMSFYTHAHSMPSASSRFGLFLCLHYGLAMIFDGLENRKHLMRSLSHFSIVYPIAILVALPYLVRLATFGQSLEATVPGSISSVEIGVFYAAFLLASLPVCFQIFQKRPLSKSIAWSLSLFLATLFLGKNDLWGWTNHPYRFIIHLLFPLALLAPQGLFLWKNRAPLVFRILALWLCCIGISHFTDYLFGKRRYVWFIDSRPTEQTFYQEIQQWQAHKPHSKEGLFLTPPRSYLDAIINGVTLINVTGLRGFLPDPRYISDHVREEDRIRIFYTLFPFSSQLHTTQRLEDIRTSSRSSSTTAGGWKLRNPRLKNSMARIEGIQAVGWVRAVEPDETALFQDTLKQLQWKPISIHPEHLWYETNQETLPGEIAFDRRSEDPQGLRVTFTASDAGSYVFFMSGLGIPSIDGQEMNCPFHQEQRKQCSAHLTAGAHQFFFHCQEKSMDCVYFLTGMKEEVAPHYVMGLHNGS